MKTFQIKKVDMYANIFSTSLTSHNGPPVNRKEIVRLQIFVKSFLWQLFRDVDSEHVDAHARERARPTVGQKKFVLRRAHG